MNTTENNKLIAEFMGWEYDENNDWYFTPHRVEVTDGIYDNEVPSDLFEFHSDWDWLMPVVNRILFIKPDFEYVANLEVTYPTVVEFIKQYNK